MIAILDYGLGNARAFHDIYRRLGAEAVLARTPAEVAAADRIVLPGVGAFDWAMSRLNTSGMRSELEAAVLGRQVPVMGICVGMQMLASSSEEGRLPGLGWIPGSVRKFTSAAPGDMRLPHMGWNDVRPVAESPLFPQVEIAPRFYFLHSFYYVPDDPATATGHTDYHGVFTSAISCRNVHGVQFHPEKSHDWGVQLLRTFAGL